MHWQKIDIKTELANMIGMHILVKGMVIKTGKEFYTTGYVAEYSGGIILEREEDRERGYIDCVRTFNQHCEYWCIDIGKIKEEK